jgi:hypothetical protein
LLFRLQWFLLFLRMLQTGDGCLMKDFFVSLGHWLNFWQALIIATKIFFTKINEGQLKIVKFTLILCPLRSKSC